MHVGTGSLCLNIVKKYSNLLDTHGCQTLYTHYLILSLQGNYYPSVKRVRLRLNVTLAQDFRIRLSLETKLIQGLEASLGFYLGLTIFK